MFFLNCDLGMRILFSATQTYSLQEDDLIISCMISSIGSIIGTTLLHLLKAIWDRLQHIFSGAENVSCLCDVCKQYFSLELGNWSLAEYSIIRSWEFSRKGICISPSRLVSNVWGSRVGIWMSFDFLLLEDGV
jgi:hypothetical protein